MSRKGSQKRSGRQALGRGLSALLPPATVGAATPGVAECEVDRIRPRADQPRRQIDPAKLSELAASIEHHGVLSPLVVRPVGNEYEIIVGERRWRAAQLAELRTVPIIVKDVDDRQSYEMALVENLQREDLNPLEEAEAFQSLVDDFSLTQERIAERVGRDRSTVTNALRLLKLPRAVRAAVVEGKLTAGHARALLALPPKQIEPVSRKVIARGLSVRATEELVKRATRRRPPKGAGKTTAVTELEEQLCRALATRVELKTRRSGGGQIQIRYHSLEELDRLLDVLLK